MRVTQIKYFIHSFISMLSPAIIKGQSRTECPSAIQV